MTTIDTVKETLGHSNYYMRGTFEVVDEMQGRLTRSGITDWKVGYCHRGQVMPDGAVRVGQVKVHHGDPEFPLWVRPTPDHDGPVEAQEDCALCDQWEPQEPGDDPDLCPYHSKGMMTEPQWQTTCPDCGVVDQMNVYSGVFIAEGMPLDAAEGFSFHDAKQVSTEDEWVKCAACGSTWDMAFLAIDKG